VGGGCDQAAGERAEPDPEVHDHALHPEGDVPELGRGQAHEQRRLRRPEEPVPDTRDRRRRERLPRLVHERVGAEPDSEQHEGRRKGPPAAEPVDEMTADRRRDERHGGVRREHEPGDRERDPAHVVQVDERERKHDAVPERVAEPTELKRLNRPREPPVDHRQAHAASLFTTKARALPGPSGCA